MSGLVHEHAVGAFGAKAPGPGVSCRIAGSSNPGGRRPEPGCRSSGGRGWPAAASTLRRRRQALDASNHHPPLAIEASGAMKNGWQTARPSASSWRLHGASTTNPGGGFPTGVAWTGDCGERLDAGGGTTRYRHNQRQRQARPVCASISIAAVSRIISATRSTGLISYNSRRTRMPSAVV